MEEVECKCDELVGNRAVGIRRIQPKYVEVRFILFGCPDLFPDHGRVLHTARKPRDACLLTTSVDVVV